MGDQMTTHQSAAAVAGTAPTAARLEPDAIGVAQDTVIGMATAAPTASVGLTLAAIAGAAAYASGPVIILTAIPMLIIANAYRRLNMWNANCGAAFEWVGRSISPSLGFITGWLMIMGSIIGCVSTAVVLGPSVLAIFGSTSSAILPNITIDTVVILVMLVISIVGIRITARTQVGIGLIEYVILLGIAVVGLFLVISHHHGTYPISKGWFTISGVGGHGSLAAGFLIAMFMYTGWDGTIYVNEEVKHRRVNPGRAAIMAVIFLGVIYTISVVGLQGVVSPQKLQANAPSALVYVAGVIGGSSWSKAMGFALALCVIATTGTGIVLTARIIYGMATHRVLPASLANVSRRFATPVAASIVVGIVLMVSTWGYLFFTSLANAFNDLIALTGLLYAMFYVLTAVSAITYYRRRVVSSLFDMVILGILPLAAAGWLIWVLTKSLMVAPRSQQWSLVAIVAVGLLLLLFARFVLRSPFFRIPRESDGAIHAPGRRRAPREVQRQRAQAAKEAARQAERQQASRAR
jgi:amino acid transporter